MNLTSDNQIIIFDTETTGLKKPSNTPTQYQPEIIELACLKIPVKEFQSLDHITVWIDNEYAFYQEEGHNPNILHQYYKPDGFVSDEIWRLTGIPKDLIENARKFSYYTKDIVNFFFGVRHALAHNADFDFNMLKFELDRIGMTTKFPWPPSQICSIEESMEEKGKRMSLQDLHKKATGEGFQNAHQGIVDAMATARCIPYLIERGYISL